MEIGTLIRNHRKRARLSQAALAAAIGVNKSAVAQWEIGITLPKQENMAALKLELGITQSLAVGDAGPYSGELVEDPSELALLRFWRGLSDAKRDAVVDLLRIGEHTTRKAV
jgi:transcriptional regulator with XRE-family HTH domain